MQVFMASKFPLEFGTLFDNTSLVNLKSKYRRQLLIASVFAKFHYKTYNREIERFNIDPS